MLSDQLLQYLQHTVRFVSAHDVIVRCSHVTPQLQSSGVDVGSYPSSWSAVQYHRRTECVSDIIYEALVLLQPICSQTDGHGRTECTIVDEKMLLHCSKRTSYYAMDRPSTIS